MFGDLRFDIRRQDTQQFHVFVVSGQISCGQFTNCHAFALRSRIYFLIHVGDISNVNELVGASQQPCEHIKHNWWPRIPDVREVIDGWAAYIHRHPIRFGGFETLSLPRKRIVKGQSHLGAPDLRVLQGGL